MEYLSSLSPEYIENLRQIYNEDPLKVPLSWRLFFDGLKIGEEVSKNSEKSSPQTTKSRNQSPVYPPPLRLISNSNLNKEEREVKTHRSGEGVYEEDRRKITRRQDERRVETELRILDLIEAYRQRGHLLAHLDPLELITRPTSSQVHLDLASFELENISPHESFHASSLLGLPTTNLEKILSHLKKTYCSHIAIEYMHISDIKAREWLEKRMEPQGNKTSFSVDDKKRFLKELVEASQFENFLQKSFTGQKRFSLEGAESIVPAIKQIVRIAAKEGCQELLFGMSHRGRINLLANVLKKPFKEIFKEFEGHNSSYDGDLGFSGDVKYHLGYSNDVVKVNEKLLHMSMAFNPSHLESVGPVIQGMTRAKQDQIYGGNRNAVIPLLIHGDAAVIGQGVVMEALNLSHLHGYSTGGTIHLVINNQIGFTTLPEEARSTRYCTSFAKAIEAPIFHVNGFDVESIIHVVTLAILFRMKFNRDVFIDIYCYRKYGHNEGDEPRFTQPVMYKKITSKKPLYETYLNSLVEEGTVEKDEAKKISDQYTGILSETLLKVRTKKSETREKKDALSKKKKSNQSIQNQIKLTHHWEKIRFGREEDLVAPFKAPIQKAHLEKVIEAVHRIPLSIEPLQKYKKFLAERYKKIQEKNKVDWAMGEQIAFGSLLLEGFCIRLSGQDSVRGTFSHRHLTTVDRHTGEVHMPLKALTLNKGPSSSSSSSSASSSSLSSEPLFPSFPSPSSSPLSPSSTSRALKNNKTPLKSVFFHAFNSPLSEYAVMGFDFGYSSVFPYTLTLWEAQFGDFANGAQIIIDQFLSGSEEKWGRLNGLVLLLPHGYEGQGPEHSSARLERFLQLCSHSNMIVAYPTTPSQYCHLLRRQIHSPFRKPLIVMTPKSPLRMPEVVSKKEDFLEGEFKTFLFSGVSPEKSRKLIFCTGKIDWELKRKLKNEILNEETSHLKSSKGKKINWTKLSKETSFVKIEQLYPLDKEGIKKVIQSHKNCKLWFWVQEEPKNMGAWNFIKNEMESLNINLTYIGRKSSSSVATGLPLTHKEEQEDLLHRAFVTNK